MRLVGGTDHSRLVPSAEAALILPGGYVRPDAHPGLNLAAMSCTQLLQLHRDKSQNEIWEPTLTTQWSDFYRRSRWGRGFAFGGGATEAGGPVGDVNRHGVLGWKTGSVEMYKHRGSFGVGDAPGWRTHKVLVPQRRTRKSRAVEPCGVGARTGRVAGRRPWFESRRRTHVYIRSTK